MLSKQTNNHKHIWTNKGHIPHTTLYYSRMGEHFRGICKRQETKRELQWENKQRYLYVYVHMWIVLLCRLIVSYLFKYIYIYLYCIYLYL